MYHVSLVVFTCTNKNLFRRELGQRVLGARLRAHYLPNLALNWVKRGAMERREGMYCHMNRTWNTTSHLIKISLFQGIFFASYITNDLKKAFTISNNTPT